jgi:uncharacterized protein YbcI
VAENDCLSTRLRSAVVQFYKDCFGRGPVQVRVTLGDGVAVCLLSGAMTVAERTVLAGPDAGRARDRVKRWHREVLEANRDRLAGAVEEVLGARVRSLHHDLSTAADECALVLCLDAPLGQSDTKI